MSLGRRIARCFTVPCDEKPKIKTIRGKDRGVIIQQPEEFVGEIRTALNAHFAWVRADGGWDSSTPITLHEMERTDKNGSKRKEYHIGNDTDQAFEAMQTLSFPYAPSCGS